MTRRRLFVLILDCSVSVWTAIATAPIFLWELSLGLRMTFKGFDRSAPIIMDESSTERPGTTTS